MEKKNAARTNCEQNINVTETGRILLRQKDNLHLSDSRWKPTAGALWATNPKGMDGLTQASE